MHMSAFGGKGDIPARFFAALAQAKPFDYAELLYGTMARIENSLRHPASAGLRHVMTSLLALQVGSQPQHLPS
jgi:hypothetical protein